MQVVPCPRCEARVRKDRLRKHLRKHVIRIPLKSPKTRYSVVPKHPHSNCQNCGVFLAVACYSKNRTKHGQVPRTNKICESCYKLLRAGEQKGYRRYRYAAGSVSIVNTGRGGRQ